MNISLTLTRPDGTMVDKDDMPAPGTLLVVHVDESAAGDAGTGFMRARLIGWVPEHANGRGARRLMAATCKVLNSGADGSQVREAGDG